MLQIFIFYFFRFRWLEDQIRYMEFADQTRAMREQGTHLLEQGTHLPEQGKHLPEQGTLCDMPEQGTHLPEQGACRCFLHCLVQALAPCKHRFASYAISNSIVLIRVAHLPHQQIANNQHGYKPSHLHPLTHHFIR